MIEYLGLLVFVGIVVGAVVLDAYLSGKQQVKLDSLKNDIKVKKFHEEIANAQVKKALDGAVSRADAVKRMQRPS